MSIALVQTPDRLVNQLQNNIISATQFLFANPVLEGTILTEVSLVTGNNYINHLLGRPLQGWFLIRQRAKASIYDNQDGTVPPIVNQSTTLLLVSDSGTKDSPVVVDIYVF